MRAGARGRGARGGPPNAAADKKVQLDSKNTHAGKLVSVTGNEFTMSTGDKEHKHMLAADAKVLCDGKACNLDDIKTGTMLTVTTRPGDTRVATRVEASTR